MGKTRGSFEYSKNYSHNSNRVLNFNYILASYFQYFNGTFFSITLIKSHEFFVCTSLDKCKKWSILILQDLLP